MKALKEKEKRAAIKDQNLIHVQSQRFHVLHLVYQKHAVKFKRYAWWPKVH